MRRSLEIKAMLPWESCHFCHGCNYKQYLIMPKSKLSMVCPFLFFPLYIPPLSLSLSPLPPSHSLFSPVAAHWMLIVNCLAFLMVYYSLWRPAKKRRVCVSVCVCVCENT